MDIKIEAPEHENQDKLISYYKNRLEAKYGNFKFIHALDVKVKKIDEKLFYVSLQTKPEKAQLLFVSAKANKENTALNSAIKKMNVQIEKYRQKHYHNPHKVKSILPKDIKTNLT